MSNLLSYWTTTITPTPNQNLTRLSVQRANHVQKSSDAFPVQCTKQPGYHAIWRTISIPSGNNLYMSVVTAEGVESSLAKPSE